MQKQLESAQGSDSNVIIRILIFGNWYSLNDANWNHPVYQMAAVGLNFEMYLIIKICPLRTVKV